MLHNSSGPQAVTRLFALFEVLPNMIGRLVRTLVACAAISSAVRGDEPAPTDAARHHWSYRPVVRPAVPTVSSAGWVRGPIDAFIAVEHEKRGLRASPPADPAVLLRRLYLDLIGLPPTRDELRAFLADPSEAAYLRTVDRLLASPRYGERWGRHWMDVWRYSDWYGSRAINEIRYSQRHIWRWRDWIIESLNADKGYDRMIVELLAGDELAPGDPAVTRATGFLGRNWYKFDRNVWMFEAVEQTAAGFLGLTLKCARCHEHKFDPISHEDYYRFRAFFEPHDVRTEPISGNLATEKDATLGLVLREGVSLVYDKELDAATYVFARGDNRYPDKSRVIEPAPPPALGGSVEVRPVPLPAEAFAPSLRPSVASAMIASARAAVQAAESESVAARAAVGDAERQLASFLDRVTAGESPATRPIGAAFLDRFERPRPDVWRVVGGDWIYENGRVGQKRPGPFPTMVSNVQHPRDFATRVRYKTLEAGSIHSVGVFFDVVELRNCQAVYSATNNSTSSIQAFHRQAGVEHYPAAGVVPYPIRLNQEVTVDIAARGQKLNVWVNGELAIAYTMPMPRQSGTFALWTHEGAAEFSELAIDQLPADFRLAERAAEKIRSPYATTTQADLEFSLKSAQRAATLADKRLAAAQLESVATEARIAADRAKATDSSDAGPLALAAARAERQAAAARADQSAIESDIALWSLRRAPGALDDARKKAITDAETKQAAAQEAVEAARAALAKTDDAAYTAIGPSYPRTSTGRRLALARWIADPRNPRTARVAANHIWLRHFGQAIVPTVANFGLDGNAPSHPELLDWLAAELVESGWSTKHLHRMIVTSNTYRQASGQAVGSRQLPVGDKERAESESLLPTANSLLPSSPSDPANVYLWRMNSRRMESEVVRDSLLFVTGELDGTFGGPEIAESQGQESRRRSLYFRSTPNEKMLFLELFDQANPNECYRRQESVVPQQALAMSNSALALNQARTLARRLSQQTQAADAADDVAFIRAAFEQILSRAPTADELAACERFLIRHASLLREGVKTAFAASSGPAVTTAATDVAQRARENLVHVLFSHNEFVTIR